MTDLSKKPHRTFTVPSPKTIGPVLNSSRRIICPECGNDLLFYEIAEEVTLTTSYLQNADGSFTPQSDDSRILGTVKFYCAECNHDLTRFHNKFVEMLF